MGRIKHSAAWWCFVRGEMTPERFVRTAAEIGYDAVEIVDPSYWQLVKDHSLAIASVVGVTVSRMVTNTPPACSI